jgi:FRG domain
MEVITPNSWTELQEALFDGDWNPSISRYRSRLAFRGVTDASWDMQTSLMRLGGEYWNLEKHLLRNFRKYAHRDVVERDSFWHWLTMGQHHGLPTRLLDWTYSPMVALHFATDNISKMDRDGVVWRVDIDDAHSRLPSNLKALLVDEGSSVFTVDMLAEFSQENQPQLSSGHSGTSSILSSNSIRTLKDFDQLSPDPFCMFLEPPSIDDRVVNQFALFSVISRPQLKMDELINTSGVIASKIIIPASLKWITRDRLDQANISERVIYPGLDGISQWLKRHYSRKT